MASRSTIALVTALVAMVASPGCMGGAGAPGLGAGNSSTSAPFPNQVGAASDSGSSEISQALWNNPVSRAVKGVFSSGDVAQTAYTTSAAGTADPISLSTPSKPPTPDLFIAMGQVAEQSGQTEKAREFYQKALDIEPKNPDVLTAFGRFEDRQGRLPQAAGFYKQALQADPNHAGANNDLGLCYARQGQFPQALELVRQAVRISPERPIYRNNIARVLVEMGQSQQAVVELSAVFPPAQAHYNVGWFLAQQGRREEAAAHFTAALQHDPNMQTARAWLAHVRPGASPAVQQQAARQQNTQELGNQAQSTPYGNGAYTASAAQTPSASSGSVAPSNSDMPIITNVRSVPQTAAQQPASVAFLPQPNGAGAWQGSNSATAPASGAAASTWPTQPSQQPQTGWPPSQSATSANSYIRASDNRFQTPSQASQPVNPGGPLQELQQLQGQPAHPGQSPSPFEGQSHNSPWGNVPSPYHGSAVAPSGDDSTSGALQYPDSVAGEQTASTHYSAAPTTIVNPYVANAPHVASPVQHASGNVIR